MTTLSPTALEEKIRALDGLGYQAYQKLSGCSVSYPRYSLRFRHIQNSPGASPASFCQIDTTAAHLHLPPWVDTSPARITAAEDYILRLFNEGAIRYARQNRGAGGSGSFQPVPMPQQVLKRNIVRIARNEVSIAFRMSLPGSLQKKILAAEALEMLHLELPAIFLFIKEEIAERDGLQKQCACVEDMLTLQSRLDRLGLIAFVGDGSLLPRTSGSCDLPAPCKVVPFRAPEELAVVVDLPNAGKKRGMGIKAGITALIGGGYHGKSTLVNGLAKGVYPHIPGDGRELVVSHPHSVMVCSEDGRSITGLDISSFLSTLPQDSQPNHFTTTNASGSTSEAAAVVENVLAGAKLLLIDEDSSAANFLYRDHQMRRLIPEDPITPFFDRVQELRERFAVSTLLVTGGSADYLGCADQVIAMREYLPVDMTAQTASLKLPSPRLPTTPLTIHDKRILTADNFNPRYSNQRLHKNIPVRIKPLRGQELDIIEYGMDRIDVRCLSGIVAPEQIFTIGYALLLARQRKMTAEGCSPTALAERLINILETEGLNILQPAHSPPLFLAQIRLPELAGAINRLRSLAVHVAEERD